MRRRDFILASGAAVAWPFVARAQRSNGMRLIGVLMGPAEESDPAAQSWLAAFRDGLTKLGWTADSNLRIELRWGAGDADKIATFAKELIKLQPDAVFGVTTPVIRDLARETRTIPIVFALVADPIGGGFAASLAHPGGNITGFVALDAALGGKWVGLLKEIAPGTGRVALLFNPATTSPIQFYMPSIQAAASAVSIDVNAAPVHAKDEIEGVIAAQAHKGGGLIVMPDVFNVKNRDPIVELTARYRVPTIYFNADYFAELGGLINYGDDYAEECRLAAGYIDRILKGAKPGDLPIQLPTKYELVINLKTANALGLTVPHDLLVLADEVIE
jgi:putative tryptophan/tyrosine transport system substrate-binding protein